MAEPYAKWRDRQGELQASVEGLGFQMVGNVEQRYDFLYLIALKVYVLGSIPRRLTTLSSATLLVVERSLCRLQNRRLANGFGLECDAEGRTSGLGKSLERISLLLGSHSCCKRSYRVLTCASKAVRAF